MTARNTAPNPGTTTMLAPSALRLYHRNPRRGDVTVLENSLRAHGQYKPITVNIGTHTGRPLEVLAGNHTLMAFRNLQQADPELFQQIAVYWVDVDDDLAARIIVADNRTSELGGFDTVQLVEILEGFGHDLDGIGYTELDLKMLSELNSGPPSLDDLAEKHGDPLTDDAHDVIRLRLDPEVAIQWKAHRDSFDSDTAAMMTLLNNTDASYWRAQAGV